MGSTSCGDGGEGVHGRRTYDSDNSRGITRILRVRRQHEKVASIIVVIKHHFSIKSRINCNDG